MLCTIHGRLAVLCPSCWWDSAPGKELLGLSCGGDPRAGLRAPPRLVTPLHPKALEPDQR